MERRDFLIDSCKLCMLGAIGAAIPALEGCVTNHYTFTKLPIVNKKITIPLNSFIGNTPVFVRARGLGNDVAVLKNGDGSYLAFLMNCTHHNFDLSPTPTGFVCQNHGSTYNLKGEVIKGPATTGLKEYPTKLDGENVIVLIG